MRRPPVGRLIAVLTVAVLTLAVVVVRLAVLQFGEAGQLVALGAQQRLRTYELTANRGAILDRVGTPLAITVEARDVYADPRFVVDPADTAARIAPILEMGRGRLHGLLSASGTFVYLARQVDVGVAERLAGLGLPGIGFLDASRRYYPAGTVAAQVLGFVGTDGVGLSGLEAQHEDYLAGSPGEETVEVSAQGQAIAGGARAGTEPLPGDDLVAHDRPRDPVPGAAVPARGRREQRGEGGHRRGDGSADGGHLRDGELPVVRSERLPRLPAGGPPEPGAHRRLGAGVRQQDRDGGDGARDRRRHADPALPGAGDPADRGLHDPPTRIRTPSSR